MKKYIFLSALAVSSAAVFTSCDDMLDTEPRVTEMTQATFPGKPADVEALNTATYAILNTMGGGDSDTQNPFYWWEIMSDNCYGSGGLQDYKVKCMHHLTQMGSNMYEMPFTLLYGGISRANNQIKTIDNFEWEGGKTDPKRCQLLGEGYFMRGLYTLWLTQLYGDVPLITSTDITPEMEQQVSAEDKIYPQIFSDFVSGATLMGNKDFAGNGHANKYASESFLARAYMFWAGFYKKVAELATGTVPEVALVEQEGCSAEKLTKDDVVKYVEDVIGNGGYDLCDDYRSLWQYSNSYVWKETHDQALDSLKGEDLKDLNKWKKYGNKKDGHAYDFIADMDPKNCFDMPGMGNGNTEEIFQIQFMNASRWAITDPGQGGAAGPYNTQRMYCNYLSVFWALRVNGDNGNRDCTYPFTQGWGQGTPSVNIWDDWTFAENQGNYKDIRKSASLIDCDNELAAYSYVKDDCEESGYAVKKWNGVTTDALSGDDPWWKQAGLDVNSTYKGTLDNPMQGEHYEDFYLMRLSDVYLMHAELTGKKENLNKVQRRAGVPETPYSLQAIQDERRWEFAFEGLRFNDMRRWSGKDGGENCYAAKALQAQADRRIVVKGDKANKIPMKHMTSSWKKRYADTDGFLPKPQTQITQMNGKLIQNKGWDASENSECVYVTLY